MVVYINDVQKMAYNDPRPYWTYSKIKFYKCSTDFGNPSGISIIKVILLAHFAYILIFLYKNFKKI